MKKKKHNNKVEPLSLSLFDVLFSPTIDMAAELMNVPVNVVEEWLSQEHLTTEENDRLSEAAIDFLADKYVSRLHTGISTIALCHGIRLTLKKERYSHNSNGNTASLFILGETSGMPLMSSA